MPQNTLFFNEIVHPALHRPVSRTSTSNSATNSRNTTLCRPRAPLPELSSLELIVSAGKLTEVDERSSRCVVSLSFLWGIGVGGVVRVATSEGVKERTVKWGSNTGMSKGVWTSLLASSVGTNSCFARRRFLRELITIGSYRDRNKDLLS